MIIILPLMFVPILIILVLANTFGPSQRREQTRALIKAQRDLAIEKGEIEETTQSKETTQESGWDWYSPEDRKAQPKSPPKPVGEHFNFATQKWE
jgi:hypothetical protein